MQYVVWHRASTHSNKIHSSSQFWLFIRTFQANNGQAHKQDQLHLSHSLRHAALPCVPSSLSSYIKFNGAFKPSPGLLQKHWFSHFPFVFNATLSSQSASQTKNEKSWDPLNLLVGLIFVVANHTFQWFDMNANTAHYLTWHHTIVPVMFIEWAFPYIQWNSLVAFKQPNHYMY